MQFVSGLPEGVMVTQTQIEHPDALASDIPALQGFNLALHVHDQPQRVFQHRAMLLNALSQWGVERTTWMNQTHSTICHRINTELSLNALEGDGLVTQAKGHALIMMTADCLPIVLGNADGTEVANLHAGWRGLANGIVQQTVANMQTQATWAWLGAAISQAHFEVGEEVKMAFCSTVPELELAFKTGANTGKYQADLYHIARVILNQLGIHTVLGGTECTYAQADQYYSYRRDPQSGRMATVVFMR